MLEKARAETARARSDLEAARSELLREREVVQRERERLRELERQTRAGAREDLIEDLRKRRDEVAALIAQLQAAPAMAQAVEAQRAVEEAAVSAEREQAREEEPQALPDVAVESGTKVKHVRLGTQGVVLEVHGGYAMVQMGALRSKVALADLVPISGQVAQAAFRKTAQERLKKAEQARPAAVQVRVPVVDVRGLRVDEALRVGGAGDGPGDAGGRGAGARAARARKRGAEGGGTGALAEEPVREAGAGGGAA